MPDSLRLTAILQPRGPAGAFLLSDDQVAQLGAGRKAFGVLVTVNGVQLQLRVARMGGENMIGLARAARAAAGVELGGEYEVTVAADLAAREIEVPDDLAQALAADAQAHQAFAGLAPSHRKEFVRWITEAKRDATRADRVTKTVEMVRAGRTR
jgi:hypothetical protein